MDRPFLSNKIIRLFCFFILMLPRYFVTLKTWRLTPVLKIIILAGEVRPTDYWYADVLNVLFLLKKIKFIVHTASLKAAGF